MCVIFPPFLLVLLYNSSAYNKSPLTTIPWCCIAAAGNRATIPLENVVPHKQYFNNKPRLVDGSDRILPLSIRPGAARMMTRFPSQ